MAEFRVPTDTGDVLVDLAKIPTDLKARNEAIDAELTAGRYRAAQPSMLDTTLNAAKAVGQTAGPYVAPLAGIGVGAARGATMGAPFFPPFGAFAGGVGGAMLGGITGTAANAAADLGRRTVTGEPPRPTLDVLRDVVGGGAKMGLESTPPGLVASGAYDLSQGNLMHGAMKMGFAAMPGVGRFLGSNEDAGLALVREATNKAARAWGVEMSAAQQSGKPMLRGADAFIQRSFGGSGVYQNLGARQNEQMLGATQEVGENLTGKSLDQMTRNNRFMTALEGRVTDLKKQADQMFGDYIKIAGPASPVDVTTMVTAAQKMLGEMPKTPSLQNGRLKSVLSDIVALGQPIPPTVATSPITDPFGRAIQTVTNPGGPQITTLQELRRIRTALGDIAFPDSLNGAVVTDVPIGAARHLYGTMTGALEQHAAAQGPQVAAKLAEANQFYKTVVQGFDGKFYAGILASEKRLGQFSNQLFNPRDTGMLMDAKTATTPEGFKMIQQQYWDDVFSPAAKGAIKETDAGSMLLGKQFGDRIARDQNVLKVLFDAEGVKAINELAGIARTVESTMSLTRSRAFTTGMMGYFQAAGAGGAITSMATQGPGLGNVGSLVANTTVPFLLGHAFTNPTTARMIAAAAKHGSISAETGETVARYLLKFTAIGRNQSSVNVPVPEGLQR